MCIYYKPFIVITAHFERRVYRVHEHDGSIAPKLNLNKPSPCCFTVHAYLQNDTADGELLAN